MTSHGAITALGMNKPIIVGAEAITALVQDGQLITLELDTGIVDRVNHILIVFSV